MALIVRLEREHIPEVAQIERSCFPDPWSEEALELLLEDRCAGLVATVDGRVAAYGGMMIVLDEAHVLNIATHPDFRRQGLARAVIEALEALAAERGASYLYLEVREKNSAARALYNSVGWRAVGLRKNFYSHPIDNAVIMMKEALKGN